MANCLPIAHAGIYSLELSEEEVQILMKVLGTGSIDSLTTGIYYALTQAVRPSRKFKAVSARGGGMMGWRVVENV